MPLLWETPGGGCDDDDVSVLHSCARELKEEAGLETISVGPLVRCSTAGVGFADEKGPGQGGLERGEEMGSHMFFTRKGKLVSKFYFVVEAKQTNSVVVDPTEHTAYIWATEEEATLGDMWEQHKPTLRQLYQVERVTLPEVKVIIERDYGFPETPLSTYESKLRKMQVRKKMKKTDWHAVFQELQRRGEKQSAVYLCGTMIPSTNAWKEIRRSGAMSNRNGQQTRLPREVVVRTPSPGNQSRPLPLTFRRSNDSSSCGILASQNPPATLQQAMRPLPNRNNRELNVMSILDLPERISDLHKALLQHTPLWIFKLELSKTLKEPAIPSMNRSDLQDSEFYLQPTTHADTNSIFPAPSAIRIISDVETLGLTIDCRQLFETVYILSNNLCDPSEEADYFDQLFAHFPPSSLLSFLAINLPTIQVLFQKTLKYYLFRDRRDDFQALVKVIAHDHPCWLVSAADEYLFYAATMNCLQACHLLLGVVEATPFKNNPFVSIFFDLSWEPFDEEQHCYDYAIFSAISAGYFECARLLIQYLAQNSPLLQHYSRDATLPPSQPDKPGVAGHGFEYPKDRIMWLFLHCIFITQAGGFYFKNASDISKPLSHIRFRFEMENVQRGWDIFIEFGLNVDELLPPCLQHKLTKLWDLEGFRARPCVKAVMMSSLYLVLKPPPRLQPTILDIVCILDKNIFNYFVCYSKYVATQLTRSGLYLAAERGSEYLYQYLDTLCPHTSDCQVLLGIIVAEQFIGRFNFTIAHMLLSRGVGFGAFPRDLNLSLPLGHLVTEIKQHSITPDTLDILNRLLREGAIIDADVMASAVEPQGTDLLKLLFNYDADFGTHGTLALFAAAKINNYEAVDWLLEIGVNINAGIYINGKLTSVVGGLFEWFNEHTPMFQKPSSRYYRFFRAFNHNLKLDDGVATPMLKYLVGRGASLSVHPGNSRPNNLLLHAIRNGMFFPNILEIVAYLLATQGKFCDLWRSQSCLLEACFQLEGGGRLDTDERILQHGLPIFNFLLANGVPIIDSGMLALITYHGAKRDLIQTVIDKGVDINAYCGQGGENESPYLQTTPLQGAARIGDFELVKLLIKNGAEINLPGQGFAGATALQRACELHCESDEGRRNQIMLVEFLIENGADVNATAAPNHGMTALQAAAYAGNLEIIMVLLNHGANVNAPPAEKQRGRGFCALDFAVFAGRLDVTKFLLDLGAVSCDQGESGYDGAIFWAEQSRHWAVADLIRERATFCARIRNALEEAGL
ncbi:hypothetical protein NUW58_g7344 [Xylaria curta]|uniref:Uncharacterized protein n=1 Tax=Xylaria curta TaxID=42375 RepID=A0ACC1NIL3_9PEZI|nr:hypothetical protein NUW58_g7344 [Xylaria curta]